MGGGRDAYLESEIVVLLFLLGSERVPPFTEDLGNGPIVLVGVALVYQRSMPLAEDHECIHRPSYVILLFRLCNGNRKNGGGEIAKQKRNLENQFGFRFGNCTASAISY